MATEAGTSGRATTLEGVAHDARGGLAAATAYLDLARERLAQGEPITDEDLAAVERGLARVQRAVEALDAIAKGAPR